MVIGTEFDDKYVVTKDAVYGAGRYITFANIERLKVYGMQGRDTFYVLSTNPKVETALYGGLGSDRVEVGAAAPAVQANDYNGHTGLIRNTIESTGSLSTAWTRVRINGIAAEILDDDAPALVVSPIGGAVKESSGTAITQQFTVRPTKAPDTWVYVTFSAPVLKDQPDITTAVQVSVNGGAWGTTGTLVFAPGSVTPITVRVRAAFDLVSEGTLLVPLATAAVGALRGTVVAAGNGATTTLKAQTDAFKGRDLAVSPCASSPARASTRS